VLTQMDGPLHQVSRHRTAEEAFSSSDLNQTCGGNPSFSIDLATAVFHAVLICCL
jgi:hypothetical protein